MITGFIFYVALNSGTGVEKYILIQHFAMYAYTICVHVIHTLCILYIYTTTADLDLLSCFNCDVFRTWTYCTILYKYYFITNYEKYYLPSHYENTTSKLITNTLHPNFTFHQLCTSLNLKSTFVISFSTVNLFGFFGQPFFMSFILKFSTIAMTIRSDSHC